MATEVPFGLTFGNPSKYIGSSGVGQAVKTGLTAYAMQKSGLTGFLNDLNKKPTPEGSVPPIASSNPMSANGMVGPSPSPVQPPNFNTEAPQQAVAPDVPPPSSAPGVVITPIPDTSFPSDIGHQILDGNDDWQHSAVNPQAQRDSLVLPPQQTIQPPQLTGNEYQQVPGYGSAKKAAMAMFGMG